VTSIKSWYVRAYNSAIDSENKIHEDRVAQRHGFKGGLVPGTTVFAYLTHPAVALWGEAWLDRGRATIALHHPFYDGERVHVDPKADSSTSYACELRNPEAEVCASGTASIPETVSDVPTMRGDPPAPERWDRPRASRGAFERLRKQGLGSIRVAWRGEPPNDRYSRSIEDMPGLVRPDMQAFAHPGFVLGLANRILDANVALGPWIHAESELQNHSRLALGRSAHVEASVVDLFERGGHEFVDLEVHAFLKEGTPVMSARHRAIYRLREG
jgi:hypothetical protein